MSLDNLTEEQHQAVTDPCARLVVRASAGAGKTRVLVARYLRLIQEEHLTPDQILTITFTRKAAAEMKQRIVGVLAQAGLKAYAQMAETGPIQTIHGFCERLLREVSVDAGLDPEFTVMDEATATQLKESAIRLALAAPDLDRDELGLLERLAGKGEYSTNSVHAQLERALGEALEAFRGSGHTPEHVRDRAGNSSVLLAALQEDWFMSQPEAVRQLALSRPATESLLFRVFSAAKSLKLKTAKPSTAEAADAENQAMACDASALARLVVRAWHTYEASLAERSALDFVGLEARAYQLLTDSPLVQRRVCEAYRVVMVDEAQDLSPLQHRLLGALGLPAELRVGDAQQSIYGFRQADVRLFEQMTEELPTRVLSQNFRSIAGVQAFVDAVFRELWGSTYVPLRQGSDRDPFDGVELWQVAKKAPGQVAELLQELVEEGENPGDIAVLVREGRSAAQLSQNLTARGLPNRIAGGSERFYTRLEVRDLANALAALADPENDFALLAILRSPLVGLSLDSLVLLAAERSVWERLPGFQAPIPADQERLQRFFGWFGTLTRAAARQSAVEVLGEIFHQSPYLENLARRSAADQRLANVRKLVRLAAERPAIGPKEFAEFIRELRELRHKEGEAPAADQDPAAIRIMTIHKAKGLEFPVVVVPDLHGSVARNMKPVEVDKATGTLTVKFTESPTLLHTWNSDRRKARETEEAIRLLYVALTRAERRLCVAVDPTQEKTLAGKVAKAIGFRDGPVRGARLRLPRNPDQTGSS